MEKLPALQGTQRFYSCKQPDDGDSRICQNVYHTTTTTTTTIIIIIIIIIIAVKVKVTLEQATKAQRGIRGIALLFL